MSRGTKGTNKKDGGEKGRIEGWGDMINVIITIYIYATKFQSKFLNDWPSR